MTLDLYFALSMKRSVPIRSIMLAFVVILTLLGGIIFWRNKETTLLFSPTGEETIRHQLQKKFEHPLLVWEKTLAHWSSREETTTIAIDLVIHSPLEHADIPRTIPVMSGSVRLTQTIWSFGESGSGSLQIEGNFLVDEMEKKSLSGTDGIVVSGSENSGSTIIALDATLQFLWSGSTTRWYLEKTSLLQSGSMYEFPIILRAFLQEYANSWIEQHDTPSWIQDIRTFAIYKKLTEQIDQHLVTTSSGNTQLLIDGPERGIDAMLDTQGMAKTQIRFPKSGIRIALEEQNNGYAIAFTHYRLSLPVLTGTASFASTKKTLTNNSQRSGSPIKQISYYGSHTFSVRPLPHFIITPPTQVRNRETIVAGRKNNSESEY